MIFDVKKYSFIHEPTGYTLWAERLWIESDDTLIEDIATATGVEVDDFFLDVLRDTVSPFSGGTK